MENVAFLDDLVLVRFMKASGVGWYKRWKIYLAVRAGGWAAYRAHAPGKPKHAPEPVTKWRPI